MKITAYEKAQQVLDQCISEIGMKASALSEGYTQVWARDCIITFLGASMLDNEKYQASFQASLETLQKFQNELGMIPLNVDSETVTVETANSGGVDANLWYIIGHYVYYKRYGDLEFLKSASDSIDLALLWLRYQDSNGCGLLEVHEAADWADLLAHRYNILYDNALYKKALDCYAEIRKILGKDSERYEKLSQEVTEKINFLLWTDQDLEATLREATEKGYPDEWKNLSINNWDRQRADDYYIPYAAFRDCGTHFDSLGNFMAILCGVADERKTNKILNYIHANGVNRPYPVMAIYPPIFPGDKDWKEYYRIYNLNLPYQYHNGGIWPFIGGFYIAALVKAGRYEEAEQELENLAKANYEGLFGEWEFNEWLNSRTGTAAGNTLQAWSAGMYIFAYQSVMQKNVEF